jgi:transcriptional regulator with XRE-family HTH domain
MNNTINNKIKKSRQELGYSQEEFAELIGVNSRTSISQIESGTRNISIDEIKNIAQKLNVSADYLLDLEKDIDVILEKDKSTKN